MGNRACPAKLSDADYINRKFILAKACKLSFYECTIRSFLEGRANVMSNCRWENSPSLRSLYPQELGYHLACSIGRECKPCSTRLR